MQASPRREGRVRRFVRRYGWRAYAVPVLIAATLAALVDVAVDGGAVSPPTGGTATEALPPATLASLAEQLTQGASRPGTGAGLPTEVVRDPHAAVRRAQELAGPAGAVLATGSIYLVADLVGEAAGRRASAL